MPRKPELSATQLAASGLATVTATVGASYLGVAGTLWGAAFMSVASTAGIAVYKHYLEQGKQQIWERTQTPEQVEETAADITRADPTRTVVWPAGTHADNPTEVLAGLRQEPGEPGEPDARPARGQNTLDWLKRRWVVLAASSVAVFAVVMGGVTLVEALADKPVSSLVGATDDKGTSFGNVGGSKDVKRDKQRPSEKPTEKGKGTPAPERSSEKPEAPPTTKPSSPKPTTKPTQPAQPPDQPKQPEQPGQGGEQQAPRGDGAGGAG